MGILDRHQCPHSWVQLKLPSSTFLLQRSRVLDPKPAEDRPVGVEATIDYEERRQEVGFVVAGQDVVFALISAGQGGAGGSSHGIEFSGFGGRASFAKQNRVYVS